MTARVEFCSALQFWNAKSKDCEIPPLPPTPLCVFQKSGSVSQEFQQKAQPLSSRSGNKQYHCHSLPAKKQNQCNSTRRLHCENYAWCKKQSSNTKRSVSYSEPTKIEPSTTTKCNFSTSNLLRTLCNTPVWLSSSPLGHQQSQSDISTTSDAVDLSVHLDASTSSFQSGPLAQSYTNHATSTLFYNTASLPESLSSINMLLPSSQSGGSTGRHTPIYRSLETHTPVLETLSPIPVRPFRPQCELWKLSDFLEIHGGTGGLLIDSHGRVFDNEKRYERFLQEEEQRQVRIDMEMEDLIAQARELVLINDFNNKEPHDEEEAVGDTAIIGINVVETGEPLTDSLEDDNDEVWGRVDCTEKMDDREDWWGTGDGHGVSTETLRAAVTKILRVTNPDIPSTSGSLDSFGYNKHYTTPEASSISLLADISLEEPVAIPTFTNASTSPLLEFSIETTESQPKHTSHKFENLPQPRRSLYEKFTHSVRSRKLTELSSVLPTIQSRKRFPLEDDDCPTSSLKQNTENHASKRQKLNLKRDKKLSEDCGSISSIKPFRKALMNLSLRKYTINNATSEKLKALSNSSEMVKKENGPDSSGVRRKKRLAINGFWGNFLHGI